MLEEERAVQDGVDTSTGDALDHAKSDHDHENVRSVKAVAIAAARELGITMTPREETTALGLLPKATASALQTTWIALTTPTGNGSCSSFTR